MLYRTDNINLHSFDMFSCNRDHFIILKFALIVKYKPKLYLNWRNSGYKAMINNVLVHS